MKKIRLFKIFPLAFSILLLGSMTMAQTKEEKAKEEELKAKQEQLRIQGQQMKEQQLKTMELERAYAEQARAAVRERSPGSSYAWTRAIGDDTPFFVTLPGQGNQSQLTLRNSFDGNSDSAEGEFDVDESTTHIRCTINGKVNAGKINIKVQYPGGKVFKDLSITSSAQISFTQSLSIKEEEKGKYVGSWTYKITADKAEGSYNLSFMTQ